MRAIPSSAAPRTRTLPPRQTDRFRSGDGVGGAAFSLSLFGISLFLFVIHSFRLPVGQLAIAIAAVGIVLEARRPIVTRSLVVLACFALWATICFFVVPNPAATSEKLADFVKTVVVYALVLQSVRTVRLLLSFCVVFLAMFAVFPVRGALMNMLFGIQTQGRYAWNETFANPNDLAGYSLLLMGIAGAILLSSRTAWIRLSALIGLVLLPVMMFFTQSRGALLGLFVGAAIIFLSEKRKTRIALLGIVVSIIASVFAPEGVWDRLGGLKNITSENLRDVDREGSAEQRFTIWQTALAISRDHPVFGVGFGNYPLYNAQYASTRAELRGAGGFKDTHSMYLNVLAETGVVGLILLLLLIGITLNALIRSVILARQHPSGSGILAGNLPLLAALFAFLTASIFATLHHSSHFLLFLVTCERWAYLSRLPYRATTSVPSSRTFVRRSAPFVP